MLADPLLDMVVLDELTYMVAYDRFAAEECLAARTLNARPRHQTVIITGRAAVTGIFLIPVDTVSELRPVKHA